METPTRDTSQHGNFENFRNATYNDRALHLTSAWFLTTPLAGRLNFDFVSTHRSIPGIKPASDSAVKNMLSIVLTGSPTARVAAQPASAVAAGPLAHTLEVVVEAFQDGIQRNKADLNPSSARSNDGSSSSGGSSRSSKSSNTRLVGEAEMKSLNAQMKKEKERKKVSASQSQPQSQSPKQTTSEGERNDPTKVEPEGATKASTKTAPITSSHHPESAVPATPPTASSKVDIPRGKAHDMAAAEWLHQIDSSWSSCKHVYIDYLNLKLRDAMQEIEGEGTE